MSYECSYPALAGILYEALSGDPFYGTLEAAAPGNAAERRDAMLRYLDYSMLEARRHGLLCMPDWPPLAVAVWSKPVDAGLAGTIAAQKKSFIERHMGAGCRDAYTAISANMQRLTGPHVEPGSWYLSILGVSPEAQGGGIGAALMRQALEKTDEAGAATYLETFTPRNVSFYTRLGYEQRATLDEPRTGAAYTVMVRGYGKN